MKVTSAPSRAMRRQQWLERIDAKLRAYGVEATAPLALQALSEGVEHPTVMNLAAWARYDEGRFDDAVRMATKARVLAPNDPHILNTLASSLRALGRTDEALRAYGVALRIDPNLAAAHFNRGALLEEIDDINGSRSAYEQAAKLDRNYVEPLAALAWLDAQAGDAPSARARAQHTLALAPTNELARMAMASAGLQEGILGNSGTNLSAVGPKPALPAVNRSIVLGLNGGLQEAEGRPAEGFPALPASNPPVRGLDRQPFEAPGQESALGF